MPHDHPPTRLFLPPGFYAYSLQFAGPALPLGAAVTGCGVNPNTYLPSDIAGLLRGNFVTRIIAFLTTAVQLTTCTVRLGSLDNTGASAVATGANDGSSVSAPTSPAVAYLAHWQSTLGGKRGRGRWYLPGVGEDKVDQAGNVVPSTVTAMTTALQALRNDCELQGIPLAVGHRYEFPPGEAVTVRNPSTIVSGFIDGRAATQRNRQRR